MRFDADYSASICLHDEGATVGLAVLELVRHLLLEVVDAVEPLCLQVPNVEDAGLLFCPHTNRDEHLVALDACSLPDMVRREAWVKVLNAVVVEGIPWV